MNIFNSLSRKKEEFKPYKKNEATIYTCGPTVYDYAHIGNMRAYVFADSLQRLLNYEGIKPKWVMNLTDVDDKTIKNSKTEYPNLEPKEALIKFTRQYENFFFRDTAKLNIKRENFAATPRATDHIKEMQELIKKLFKKKLAYVKDGSIYFSIENYKKEFTYGVLSKLDLSKLKKTERVKADEYTKDNVQDFALWKRSEEGEPSWSFRLGVTNHPGRPGWHVECSAMSVKYLGQPFDIHTGGVDHIFPHHENEIAQSTGATGKMLANYFLHEEFLMVDGKKMSKSLGNLYIMEDIVGRGFDALALRYMFLSGHYRDKLNFTWESLGSAEKSLKNLRDFVRRLRDSDEVEGDEVVPAGEELIDKYRKKFFRSLDNDLDTPGALAAVNELINTVNKIGVENVLHEDAEDLIKFFEDIDWILGLDLVKEKEKVPVRIRALAEDRETARKNGDFAKADELRGRILKSGYIVEDLKSGPRIVKK